LKANFIATHTCLLANAIEAAEINRNKQFGASLSQVCLLRLITHHTIESTAYTGYYSPCTVFLSNVRSRKTDMGFS